MTSMVMATSMCACTGQDSGFLQTLLKSASCSLHCCMTEQVCLSSPNVAEELGVWMNGGLAILMLRRPKGGCWNLSTMWHKTCCRATARVGCDQRVAALLLLSSYKFAIVCIVLVYAFCGVHCELCGIALCLCAVLCRAFRLCMRYAFGLCCIARSSIFFVCVLCV